jgi:nicotinamidase-related amidase
MTQADNTYVLITQCLQNGFFFAEENRLCLPKDVVARMLVGYDQTWQEVIEISPTNRRTIKSGFIEKGPLYQFLKAISDNQHKPSNLHILNIRDWHAPSDDYDMERRLYGIHCEANTWEAQHLDGYQPFLAPWTLKRDAGKQLSDDELKNRLTQARSLTGFAYKNAHYYDILSDSVFDFRAPASQELTAIHAKAYEENQAGNTQDAVYTDSVLGGVLNCLAEQTKKNNGRLYVVLIGVYSDIKIKTLLIGLRTRYNIQTLVVSDVLTGSPTNERHIEALDFFDKVLAVEIVHSLTELVHILEPSSRDELPRDIIKGQLNFAEYRTYFRDKQMVLSAQDKVLLQYSELTSKRNLQTYKTIQQANVWLIRFGWLLLILTVVFASLKFFEGLIGVQFPTEVLLTTLGLTVAQLLTSFFLIPMAQLRNNVTALVRLQNYLETYSSISALLRFHTTKLNSLHFPESADEQTRAKEELTMLRERIQIIQDAAKSMSENFRNDFPLLQNPPQNNSDSAQG